jgi:hypothetical protein
MHEDDDYSGRDNDPTATINAGTDILLLTRLVKPMRPRENPTKNNGTAIRYALYFYCPYCFFPAPVDVPHSSRHGDALHMSRCGRRVRGKISELGGEDGIVESVINTRLPG